MVRNLNRRLTLIAITAFPLALAMGWLSQAAAADLTLSWFDNSNNETGFLIERKTGTNGIFAQIVAVGANVKSYVDKGLVAGTHFCYRVRAYNSAGLSAYTPQACKTTPGTAPAFNFSLAHGGNKSLTRGQSVSNVVTATLASASSQSVSFSTSGLPSGASASYAVSNSCTPTCSRTLNIATSSSTPTGTYPITVVGTGGGVTQTATFNLAVTSATSSATSSSETSGDTIAVEAEKGILTAPMVIRSDGTASGGKYVEVSEGRGNNYNDATKGGPGEVRFSIAIPQSGTRALWARTIAPAGGSDSFYVTRNGQLVREWSVPRSATWEWNKVADLSLASGNVNLAFRQREDGTKLDQIIVTRAMNFNPGSGLGLSSSSDPNFIVSSGPALAGPASTFTLNVSVVKTLTNRGSGNGTIISAPAGVNCGSDCSKTYRSATVVKLTPIPAAGSVFGGWNGNADCADGSVTVNADVACIGTFNPQSSGLNLTKSGNGTGTVTSSPSGINCGSDCSEPYPIGTSVKLTAKATAGSVFRGWSNDECDEMSICTVVVTGNDSVTAVFDTTTGDSARAKIGVYRPSTDEFFLDRNGNGRWDGCNVDICFEWLAQKSGYPVAGNWDGTGTTRVGTFDLATGKWYLDRNGNGRWDGCNVDACVTSFSVPGDFPVVRDLNGFNGSSIGVFRSAVFTTVGREKSLSDWGVWKFDANGNTADDGCDVDSCFSKYGDSGDRAVIGDWDGGGMGKMGLFARDGTTWLLDYNGNGLWDGCNVDKCISNFGQKHDLPIAGDWDGAGKSNVGVFRASSGEWFLDKDGNGRLDNCVVDACVTSFGQPGDMPVVGKW